MFALFFSLYNSLFDGRWQMYGYLDIQNVLKPTINAIGEFLTSMFNNVNAPFTTLGNVVLNPISVGGGNYVHPICALSALVLATITSIGIVVMAVKGIKRIFSVFFYGVR